MVVLLSDPQVAAVDVRDNGEPLVPLPGGARVRQGIARRLRWAAALLPDGVALKIIEGYRSAGAQSRIIAGYTAALRARFPKAGEEELFHLASRYVAPLAVAPHVAGAAVDLTLVDVDGRELDIGTAVDATPEDSDGGCYFAATRISREARSNRAVLAEALGSAGLVNYPTEWWHWSYGDRYWAITAGATHAHYGPVGHDGPVGDYGPVGS
jgi:zinc D-Ala-D-Ala dipeptidase